MGKEYDLDSEFDLEKHKKKFVHYLEIVIKEDGHVEYAVPSHQEKLIQLACEKTGLSRKHLSDECPPEYYFDFCTYLSMRSGAMAVWETHFISYSPTKKQICKLKQLKLNGLYTGAIPRVVK